MTLEENLKIYNFYHFGRSLFENHSKSKGSLKFAGKKDDYLM